MVHFEQDSNDPSRCHVLRGTGRIPLAAFLAEHDIVVNCVLQDTAAPLMFVTAGELSSFASGSLIVDVSCDEGMGFSWARPTTFAEPMVTVGNNVHYYAVDHSPSHLWNSATWEISEALLPHLRRCSPAPGDGTRTRHPAVHRNPRRGDPQPAHPVLPAPFTGVSAPTAAAGALEIPAGPDRRPHMAAAAARVSELRCTRCGPAAQGRRSALSSGPATSAYSLASSRIMPRLSPDSSLRRCRIPFMPARRRHGGEDRAAEQREPAGNVSQRHHDHGGHQGQRHGRYQQQREHRHGDHGLGRPVRRPLCVPTGHHAHLSGPEPVNGPRLPEQHDMSCPLRLTRPSVRIIRHRAAL